MFLHLYSRENNANTNWIEGWLSPQPDLTFWKRKYILSLSGIQPCPLDRPTHSLARLSYPAKVIVEYVNSKIQ
jgi:hypothetical protein